MNKVESSSKDGTLDPQGPPTDPDHNSGSSVGDGGLSDSESSYVPTEKLYMGDEIGYRHPIMSNAMNGTCRAEILSIRTENKEYPLVLSNADKLPSSTPIWVVERDEWNGEAPKCIMEICDWLLTDQGDYTQLDARQMECARVDRICKKGNDDLDQTFQDAYRNSEEEEDESVDAFLAREKAERKRRKVEDDEDESNSEQELSNSVFKSKTSTAKAAKKKSTAAKKKSTAAKTKATASAKRPASNQLSEPRKKGAKTMAPAKKKAAPTKKTSASHTSSRFRWKFKITEKHYDPAIKKNVTTYPILDDKNYEDFILVNALNCEQPHLALTGDKGATWDKFLMYTQTAKAPDGSFPLSYAKLTTIKTRCKEYESLPLRWTMDELEAPSEDESTTHYEPDEAIDTNGEKVKVPSFGVRSIKTEIKDGIEQYCEDLAKLEKQKKSAEEKKRKRARLDYQHTIEIKDKALGGLDFKTSDPDSSKKTPARSKVPGAGTASQPSESTSGGSRNTPSSDVQDVEKTMKEAVAARKERMRVLHEKEKRKLLEAQNKTKELELREREQQLREREMNMREQREAAQQEFFKGMFKMFQSKTEPNPNT